MPVLVSLVQHAGLSEAVAGLLEGEATFVLLDDGYVVPAPERTNALLRARPEHEDHEFGDFFAGLAASC